MRYDDPPDHVHPDVIAALNRLAEAGVAWIANSGRTLEGQLEIIGHSIDERGLSQWPDAVLHSECYVHMREDGHYVPLSDWNDQAERWLQQVQQSLRGDYKLELEALIDHHRPNGVYHRGDATVFHVQGEESGRLAFITALESFLAPIPDAHIVHNGEWIAIVHRRLGKGNIVRAYLAARGLAGDAVLTVGDHGNDLSMLDGSVTPYVACPGDAYAPVQSAVRAAGGYVASAPGPHGTLEALRHYFPAFVDTPLTFTT